MPRSRGDQRAGQSPEPKNENRPPVFARRALHRTRPANPRNRNALLLSLLPGLRGVRLQEILPRCPSRAVPLLPRSRALAISKRLLGLSGGAMFISEPHWSALPPSIEGDFWVPDGCCCLMELERRYERNDSLIRPRRKGGSLVPKKSRSDAIREFYRRAGG